MLNLSQVAEELSNVGKSAETNRNRTDQQLSVARTVAAIDSQTWAAHQGEINSAPSTMLSANLLEEMPFASSFSPIDLPETYSAIAVDGSQIPIDRHAALPYFLINIGYVVLHYGTGERPLLRSEAQLFHTDEDISSSREGERSFITENEIADRRSTRELSKTSELIGNNADRNPMVALIDGPLVLWAQDPNNRQQRTSPAIKELCTLISASNAYKTVLAGYISRPGSREVINILKKAVKIIPELSEFAQAEMNWLTDAQLFAKLLPNGRRSGVFESQAKVLKSYDFEVNRIGFFYLNTGNEIARVEIPLNSSGANRADIAHALILDQSSKGFGYPISLTEAHEQAVVRIEDRAAVDQLLHNEMIRRGIPVTTTRKSLSKRTRPI